MESNLWRSFFLIFLYLWDVDASDVLQINVTAGEDAELKCEGRPEEVVVLEWTRLDLSGFTVLFYRSGKLMYEDQHSSFSNRVELRDGDLKRGNLSVILRNVTSQDSGMYKCYAQYKTSGRVNEDTHSILLNVTEPDHTTPEGGATNSLFYGVIIAMVIILSVATVYFLKCRKRKNQNLEPGLEEVLLSPSSTNKSEVFSEPHRSSGNPLKPGRPIPRRRGNSTSSTLPVSAGRRGRSTSKKNHSI